MAGAFRQEAFERSVYRFLRKEGLGRRGAQMDKGSVQQMLSISSHIRARAAVEPLCLIDMQQQQDTSRMEDIFASRVLCQDGWDVDTCIVMYRNFMVAIMGQEFHFDVCKLMAREKLVESYGFPFGHLLADCAAHPDKNPIMASLFNRNFDALATFGYSFYIVRARFDVINRSRITSIDSVLRYDRLVDIHDAANVYRECTGYELVSVQDFSAFRNDYHAIIQTYRPEDLREVEAALDRDATVKVIQPGDVLVWD